MFSAFFHLKENPFGETPNVRYFYRSFIHYNALIQLHRALNSGKGLSLVLGEVGTGKTLLCRLFVRMLSEQSCATALVLQPIFDERELLIHIAGELGLSQIKADATAKEALDALQSLFLANAKAGKRNVILVDEAHKLSYVALEALRLLTNLETEQEKLVHVFLFAQPELAAKLESYQARQIRQRLAVKECLEPFSLQETEAYIKHRLEISGGTNFVRFDAGAVKAIYRMSQGVPRLINFHAELALHFAESRQERLITASLVQQTRDSGRSQRQGGLASLIPGLFPGLFGGPGRGKP